MFARQNTMLKRRTSQHRLLAGYFYSWKTNIQEGIRVRSVWRCKNFGAFDRPIRAKGLWLLSSWLANQTIQNFRNIKRNALYPIQFFQWRIYEPLCIKSVVRIYVWSSYWLGWVQWTSVIMPIVTTYFLNICIQTRYADKHSRRKGEIMSSIVTLCRKNSWIQCSTNRKMLGNFWGYLPI